LFLLIALSSQQVCPSLAYNHQSHLHPCRHAAQGILFPPSPSLIGKCLSWARFFPHPDQPQTLCILASKHPSLPFFCILTSANVYPLQWVSDPHWLIFFGVLTCSKHSLLLLFICLLLSPKLPLTHFFHVLTSSSLFPLQ